MEQTSKELLEDESVIMLTTEQVCSILNMGKTTVYKLLRSGDIPGTRRIGKSFRVRKKDIVDFLEGKS